LLSGEFDIHQRGLTGALESIWRGEPVGVVALDPTTMSLDALGLFKESKNPHAALLFLDWALGEGKGVASKSEGSWTPEEVERREKEGIKLPKRIRIEAPEDAKELKRWMDLFQQLVVGK
jgi:ABC-type Fe3+ transport system substrate-binding protein